MRERNDRVAHARSFDRAAGIYDAARPGYPADAVTWLLGDGADPSTAGPVVDVGAGTGKLTTAIVERGFSVIAVDPSPEMLGILTERLPDVDARSGTAEHIPLEDASTGLVVCAQAWHWVDPERAVPEVARVLRPGGALGLVWNERDESVGWVAELGELMGTGDAYVGAEDEPVLDRPFGELQRHEVRWIQPMTVEGLLDLARSRSYFITMDADSQAAVIASLRRLAATHPDLRGRNVFELPYVTRCYRAQKLG
jgi:SAM-dependent methyltransferase